jgi:hypothetical protein
METVLITGNTFPVKDQLRAMGGKWDADAKGWRVPADKADEARALVAGSPKSTGTATASRPFRHHKCVSCGVKASRYVKIYRSGECGDCFEERKMGY